MSFGLVMERHKDIDIAIKAATNDSITCFASASNNGGNKGRAYPASRRSGAEPRARSDLETVSVDFSPEH